MINPGDHTTMSIVINSLHSGDVCYVVFMYSQN